MADITCPMCGKPNPPDLEVCQFCEARLQPLTDELSRSQPPIHPGEQPTHKATADLEPVLPQWLRQVRQQARDSADDESDQGATEAETSQPSEAEDLLAGMQAQPAEEEEIPDWLSSLRGEDSSTSAEGNQAAPDEQIQEEESVSSLPGWISDLGSAPANPREETSEQSKQSSNNSLEDAFKETVSTPPFTDTNWRANLDAEFKLDTEATDSTPLDLDLPDWLKNPEEPEPVTGKTSDTFDFPQTSAFEEKALPEEEKFPTWMSSLDVEADSSLNNPSPDTLDVSHNSQSEVSGDMPDWLNSFASETAAISASEVPHAPVQAEHPEPTGDDLPGWLDYLEDASTQQTTPSETPAFTSEPPQAEFDSPPDWLMRLEEQAKDSSPESSTLSSWMDSLDKVSRDKLPPAEELFRNASFEPENVAPEQNENSAPAFIGDDGAPISSSDVDAIFSLEMPDWLSDVSNAGQGDATLMPNAEQEEIISPADLPSWVQAMRPVEAVLSENLEDSPDQTVEEKGPLAGLRGALPSVLGAVPSGKPKAYSLKLQTSEEQSASVALFEQLMARETHPSPMITQPVEFSHRFLRFIITIFIFLAVIAPVFLGTQINPIPFSVPVETNAAKQIIENNLMPDAPVLLVFDYEAALAGELEAAAAPLIDYMVLLKHPRLALIANSPVGAGLAERFMKLENTQVSTYYQPGQSYVNLGFLPGGATGILAFAEDPRALKPTSNDAQSAWQSPVLKDVQQLSEFGAVILLTDNIETSRVWIEQTEGKLGQAYLLIVTSAQTGPLLQPYVQSGQVDGLLAGLGNSAPIEQINSGRPGLGRIYWDAYGFGLLTAVVMISLGSLWNLAINLRKRKAELST